MGQKEGRVLQKGSGLSQPLLSAQAGYVQGVSTRKVKAISEADNVAPEETA